MCYDVEDRLIKLEEDIVRMMANIVNSGAISLKKLTEGVSADMKQEIKCIIPKQLIPATYDKDTCYLKIALKNDQVIDSQKNTLKRLYSEFLRDNNYDKVIDEKELKGLVQSYKDKVTDDYCPDERLWFFYTNNGIVWKITDSITTPDMDNYIKRIYIDRVVAVDIDREIGEAKETIRNRRPSSYFNPKVEDTYV